MKHYLERRGDLVRRLMTWVIGVIIWLMRIIDLFLSPHDAPSMAYRSNDHRAFLRASDSVFELCGSGSEVSWGNPKTCMEEFHMISAPNTVHQLFFGFCNRSCRRMVQSATDAIWLVALWKSSTTLGLQPRNS